MENPIHILLIEDNESDAALIIRHIKKAKKNITFQVVDTEHEFIIALDKGKIDFIICDFSLPQFNSFRALKLFQEKKIDIPFVVVSGTVGEETAVEIMKSGAHDCILKDNITRIVPVFHRELADADIRRENRKKEEKIAIQTRLLNLIGQSVIMADNTQTIIYWNKASESLYGWKEEEVLGRKLNDVMTSHSLYSHVDDSNLKFKNFTSWSTETSVIKKDGTSIPTQVTHTPIFDENGKLNGFIGVSFDITERMKTEEVMLKKIDELAASNEELKRMNRLIIRREMRMIELKQECNFLASKLGHKQPYPLTFINDTDQQKD